MMKRNVLLLGMAILLGACGTAGAQESSSNTISVTTNEATEYFTERDLTSTYDAAQATKITLSGNQASIEGQGAQLVGNTLTIAAEGTYIISGESNGIQLKVAANDTAKIQLVFNGVNMTHDDAVVYIESGDKVFITLADGTQNTLVDGATRTDETLDATLYSRSDLTLNGTGSLAINGLFKNAIESNDDLKIVSGTYNIEAVNHGLNANDQLNIGEATINIIAGKDGIHAENEDDLTLGNVYLNPTNLTIVAVEDGVDASNQLLIAGGTITITESEEGMEAKVIHQVDGNVTVTSTDDALNASDGSSSSEGGMEMSNPELMIVIDGGQLVVDAEGDGIDSNGTITINGGSVYVNGSVMGGNGAIDAAGEVSVNGGIVMALGTADMAQGFSSTSTQASLAVMASGVAGSQIVVTDSSGNVVAEYNAQKQFQHLIISAPGLQEGSDYTVTVDGSATTAQAALTTQGTMGGMFPGGGQPMPPR